MRTIRHMNIRTEYDGKTYWLQWIDSIPNTDAYMIGAILPKFKTLGTAADILFARKIEGKFVIFAKWGKGDFYETLIHDRVIRDLRAAIHRLSFS